MNDSSLAPVFADRRLWLFALVSALAAATGFYLIPDRFVTMTVTHTGYWCVLAAFVLFVRALWGTFREDLIGLRRSGIRGLDWASIAVVGLGGLVLIVHESFGFKVVMDELMLIGTSMSMHFNRTVLTPIRGGDVQGAFVIFDGVMDKRQLFFPFLVSILHDLVGYRPENAFVLNGILIFIFLGLVNALGRKLAGRTGGWLGVALFAGFPLLGQNATGGGFELLNIVMILATMLLGARYISLADGKAFTAFCYSAMLLVQVRYESAIFLAPVAFIILFVWIRDRKAAMTWEVIILPLLLIHCALHTRIFDLQVSSWQLESKPGFTKPFSLSYVPENLVHAVGFLFGKPTDQPNSYVLSGLGCVGVLFFLLLASKRIRALGRESPASIVSIFFTVGFAAQFALMMCYFWGQFDDPIIRRLSLPTDLWMVVAILAVLQEFPKPAFVKTLIAVACLGILAQGVPSMAAHAHNQLYLAGLETQWRREFVQEQPRKDYLVIDNSSIFWIAHQVTATTVEAAIKRRVDLAFFMKTHTFSNIFVFQRYEIDPDTGKMKLRAEDDLGPDYVLETAKAERLQTLTQTRMSRLIEIREGKKAISNPEPDRVIPKDKVAIDKAREAYLENFLRHLP